MSLTPTPTPYYVYVDEAGDRGWGANSSPVFVLSAVVVRKEDDSALRDALNGLNRAFGRTPTNELHWAQNVRDHQDRKLVARTLAEMPATLVQVAVCKDSLRQSGTGLTDPLRQYNYTVRRLLERVSWLVAGVGGHATLRFAHVRRFKYDPLHDYLDRLRHWENTTIRWGVLKNGTRPVIQQPSQMRGLQVADLAAGCTFAAMKPDRHGDYEPGYLMEIAPRLYIGPTKKLETYGLHFIRAGSHDCASHFDWLPSVRTAAGC